MFRDRVDAGQQLAEALSSYANKPEVFVFALPRGGVVVGFEVARSLGAPLEVWVVRKLGVPGQEELAMGAVSSGGVRVLKHDLIELLSVSRQQVEAVIAQEEREVARRNAVYRGNKSPPDVSGQTIILVDDGIATGATMWAAAAAVRQLQPKRLVIGVPVAPYATCNELAAEADEIVCLERPESFFAISEWYEDFRQVSDKEVCLLLERASQKAQGATL